MLVSAPARPASRSERRSLSKSTARRPPSFGHSPAGRRGSFQAKTWGSSTSSHRPPPGGRPASRSPAPGSDAPPRIEREALPQQVVDDPVAHHVAGVRPAETPERLEDAPGLLVHESLGEGVAADRILRPGVERPYAAAVERGLRDRLHRAGLRSPCISRTASTWPMTRLARAAAMSLGAGFRARGPPERTLLRAARRCMNGPDRVRSRRTSMNRAGLFLSASLVATRRPRAPALQQDGDRRRWRQGVEATVAHNATTNETHGSAEREGRGVRHAAAAGAQALGGVEGRERPTLAAGEYTIGVDQGRREGLERSRSTRAGCSGADTPDAAKAVPPGVRRSPSDKGTAEHMLIDITPGLGPLRGQGRADPALRLALPGGRAGLTRETQRWAPPAATAGRHVRGEA